MTTYPWHDSLWADLEAMLASDRVPHALLLVQPQGWGIEQVGRGLASRLLGRQERELDLDQFASPDFHVVRKPEDRTQILIAQIRALSEFVLRTVDGDRKVALVVGADLMNLSSANALLKTLEEPPPNNVLVLTCTRPDRLLPTIRSRCSVLTQAPGDPKLAERWAAEALSLGADDIRLGLWLSSGAPLTLAAHSEADGPTPGEFVAALEGMLHGDARATTVLTRAAAEVAVDWWVNVLRLALRRASGASDDMAMPVADHLAQVSPRALSDFLQRLGDARAALAGQVNRNLLFDQLAWHFSGLIRE